MPWMAMARSARGSIMPLFGQIGPCKNAGPTLYLHRTIVRNWGRSPINISETSKMKHPRKYLILTILTHEFKILTAALAKYLYAIPHSRTFPKMYCTNVLSTYHLLLKYVAWGIVKFSLIAKLQASNQFEFDRQRSRSKKLVDFNYWRSWVMHTVLVYQKPK